MHPTNNDVAVFWDIENCRPPKASSGYDLVNNIRDIAHKYGSVKLLKAYVEPDPYTKASLRSELQLSGVTLADCPHNGNKEVADKMIIVDAMLWALDYPTSATIIIITGDRDFGYAISMLRLRRYHVVVISQTRLPSPPPVCLSTQASEFFSWETDIVKTAPVPPTHNRTQSVPPAPTSRSEASPSRPRPRAASVAVGPAVIKPTPKQQQNAVKPSSGLSSSAPTTKNSFSFAKKPISHPPDTPPACSAPPPAVSQPEAAKPASPQPTATQLSSPSSTTSSVTAVDHTPPVPTAPLPPCNAKRRPPVRMDSVPNRGRIPSVLFSSPVTSVRSNISVIHANGVFCAGQDVPSSSATSIKLPDEDTPSAQPPTAISAPEAPPSGEALPQVVEEDEVLVPPVEVKAAEVNVALDDIRAEQSTSVTQQESTSNGSAEVAFDAQPHATIEEPTPSVELPSSPTKAEPSEAGTTTPVAVPPIHGTTPGSSVIVESPVDVAAPAVTEACGVTSSDLPSPPPPLDPFLDSIPTCSKFVPDHFSRLILLLKAYRAIGIHEPLMSKVAAELPNRVAAEKAIGVTRFRQFCELAQKAGIIEIGITSPGSEWVSLNSAYYHYKASPSATSCINLKSPPPATAPIKPSPPITPSIKPPAYVEHPAPPSAKVAKYGPLVDILREYQSNGRGKPTRSEVAAKINERHPRLFKEYGITKFKHYVRDAQKANIIILGDPGKGDSWICLNPSWSGDSTNQSH